MRDAGVETGDLLAAQIALLQARLRQEEQEERESRVAALAAEAQAQQSLALVARQQDQQKGILDSILEFLFGQQQASQRSVQVALEKQIQDERDREATEEFQRQNMAKADARKKKKFYGYNIGGASWGLQL